MASEVTVLIVARPGRIRDSLRTLLKTIPQVQNVTQVDDVTSALSVMLELHPGLVLLGSDLSNEDIYATSQQMKLIYPQSRCIVLVDTSYHRALATAAGADQVLLVGTSAMEFSMTIEQLLAK